MKMNLYIELHSKNCKCGGTGWVKKVFKASEECVEDKNASLIRYDHWLELGKPATQEDLIQKIAQCCKIEKVLSQSTHPAPLSNEGQDKEK